METFVNTGEQSYTWPRIQRADGRTLELAPGEQAELDVAPDFSAPHLARVKPKAVPRSHYTPPAPEPAPTPGEPSEE